MLDKKLVSFVVPVLNEEDNIALCFSELSTFANKHSDAYDFEFIFTDNNSVDRSFEILAEIATSDHRVAIFRFSRNFGYQNSIQFGIKQTRGDAVIQYDADLQDPIDLVDDFLSYWETGVQVVYGIRKTRQEGAVITLLRKGYYRLVNFVSEYEIPVDAGDFRLLDRIVIENFKGYEDYDPYIRGFLAYLGFNSRGIPYDRLGRTKGESKFKFRDLIGLGLRGIVNGSLIPIRMLSLFGMFISIGCFVWGISVLIAKLFFGVSWPSGFATLALLLITSIGLNSLFFGILGEYIANIQRHAQKRPTVILQTVFDQRKKIIKNSAGLT